MVKDEYRYQPMVDLVFNGDTRNIHVAGFYFYMRHAIALLVGRSTENREPWLEDIRTTNVHAEECRDV